MNSEFYEVYVGSDCIGKYMPLQFALILTKAIYSEFYAEPELEVTIKRMYFDTTSADDSIAEVATNE